MRMWGVPDLTPKAPIKKIDTKVNEIKVGTMVTTIERVNLFEMETKTTTTPSTYVTMVIGIIEVGPIFLHKIGSFS